MRPALPQGDRMLDMHTVRNVPSEPGIYTGSIVDPDALADAGIDGPPPVLVYVGRATGVKLNARLRRHAASPWWELIDLLASRRLMLPGWWSHSQKNTVRRTLTIPPLAMVSHAQALDWQHRNLRWGWIAGREIDHNALEASLIA